MRILGKQTNLVVSDALPFAIHIQVRRHANVVGNVDAWAVRVAALRIGADMGLDASTAPKVVTGARRSVFVTGCGS